MKKGTKRFLLGTGIFTGLVAAASALSYQITKKLVTIALDREEPKAIGRSMEIITGNDNIEQTLNFQTEVSKILESSKCEAVEIIASDGIKLVGHFYKAENAKRTIIAMHGWRSSWSRDFGMIAEFLFGNHCNVLFAEQRGQGESGGEYMGFGLTERFDCLDWINWANREGYEKMPIYLVGISMGATTVLMTAGFQLPSNVKGMIADCGFTSPYEIWKHVAKNIHLQYTSIRNNIANSLCKKKINYETDAYSTIEALKETKVPILFIHGTEDKFVPIEMTYENYKACNSPKKLFVVPGAEHGMSYVVDKEGYEKAVKEFWNEFK